MKRLMVGLVVVFAVLTALGGCAGLGRGRGPVDAFTFQAGVNKGLSGDVVGAIDERVEPKEIRVVVPAGTDMHALVATLSLSKEAVLAVVSSGNRVVQRNGVTPNDFSAPVTYSITVTGEKEPWTYRVFVRESESNARLSAILGPQGSVLQPAFSPTVHAYTLDVPFAAEKVRIEARGQTSTMKSVTIDSAETLGFIGAAVIDFTSVQERQVTIATLAEDGVTADQYMVTIRRGAPDTDATLALLDLKDLPLSPAFSPAQLSYRAVAPFDATQLVIHARPRSGVADIALASVPVGGGRTAAPLRGTGNPTSAAGAQVDFTGDRLAFVVIVTAEDQSVRQYMVDVMRAQPDGNNELAALSLAVGAQNIALAPAFTSGRLSYTAEVPYTAQQVTVFAATQSRVATVSIEPSTAPSPRVAFSFIGNPVARPGATIDFPSTLQRLPFVVEVTAQDGSVQRYALDVRRAQADRNADLASLAASTGTLAPPFSPRVVSYSLVLPASADSVKLTVAATSPAASVTVVEQPGVKPAVSQSLTLAVAQGATAIVTFVVTAEDESQRLYRVRIGREAPPAALDGNALLQSLLVSGAQLSPAFNPSVIRYDAQMAANVASVGVTALPQSQLAAVTIDGQAAGKTPRAIPVQPGATKAVVIDVTAQNGAVVRYTLRVTRDAAKPPEGGTGGGQTGGGGSTTQDTNGKLSQLRVESYPLQPLFDPSVLTYDVKVPAVDESALVTATPQSQAATFTIDGQAGDRNGKSITLQAGVTKTVFVDVRAQSGAVTRYTLRLTRDMPAQTGGGSTTQDTNGKLSQLKVESYPLQPVFDPSVLTYDVKVPAVDESALVTATAQSQVATFTIDGQAGDRNGKSITLQAGVTKTVFVDVRAQSGAVTRYTLRLTRDMPAQTGGGTTTQPPADVGRDRVLVSARNLRLQQREATALTTAGDQVGTQARVTVRYYRTNQVITQYTTPVDVRQQAGVPSLTLSYRSNGVTLSRDKLVEVETAIQTTKGKFLFYTEAQAADDTVSIEVPFLLYGDTPQVQWPAIGSSVQVGGYLSKVPLTRDRTMDKEDFEKNNKGEYSIAVEILNASTGASYGTDSVSTKPGQGRSRTLTFSKNLQIPEGATVKYVLSAKAKNGKTWSATDTTQVWTTKMNYPSGFMPVLLFVTDDLVQGK